jgi:hypothetical protein
MSSSLIGKVTTSLAAQKWIYSFFLLISAATISAQDLSNIKGSKPFKISGVAGTTNTFYISNRTAVYRDPVSFNAFANLNVSVYDFDIPFSFYFTNRNLSFSHPFIHFGISPRYKAIRFHFGYRSMNFSPFTYNGLTFLGGGIEVDYKILRFGVFTGTLNQARPLDNVSAQSQPISYRRSALGVKLGIGRSNNFFDLIFFKASDDTNSIPLSSTRFLIPKENIVIGTNLKLTPFKRLTLTSEIAASAYNENARVSEINHEKLDPYKNLFTVRYNTVLRLAANARATINLGKATTSLSYQQVQPDYYTLGSTYMINNFSSYGWDLNTQLFKNRIFFNGMLGYQTDNITKRQIYTNQVVSYMANVMARVSNTLNVSTNYNGYRMNQTDGTLKVTDSLKLDQMMHNLTIAPSYTLMLKENSHSVNINYTLSRSDNLNPLREDFSDYKSNALGLNYSYFIKQSGLTMMGNFNYQASSSSYYSLVSNTMGAGIGKKFLKEGNLNVNLNANLSNNNINKLIKNTIINLQMNALYTYKKNHNANIRIALNSSFNRIGASQSSLNGTEMVLGLGYSYRFSPKPKSSLEKEKEK